MPRCASRMVVAGAALVGLACGSAAEPAVERPNLVLVSIDTLRADHLGCYGYGRDTSPNLDRLAREGVLFEHAYTTAPWTLPAHVSLFTGLYAVEHGVTSRNLRIDDAQILLPEALAELGYRSGGVVSTVPFVRGAFGFRQGWEVYDDHTALAGRGRWAAHVAAPKVHLSALRLLDRLGGDPFFLFVHHFDVHGAYVPPPPYDALFGAPRAAAIEPGWNGREAPAKVRAREMPLYDGEIRWVDHWVGELMAELRRRDLLERTVVAVVADHGEEFFEHGEWQHGKNLYDTTLHVPWIVRLPGGRHAGRRIAAPVSLVDVPATLLALAGGAASGWRSGRNVLPWLEREPIPGAAAAPLFAARPEKEREGSIAVLSEGYKAIFRTDRTLRPLPAPVGLFRLAGDPGETNDLSALEPATLDRLRRRLASAMFEQLRRQRQLPPQLMRAAAPGLEAELRGLGYL